MIDLKLYMIKFDLNLVFKAKQFNKKIIVNTGLALLKIN